MLLCSCSQKQERVVTPYGSVLDSAVVVEDFDLAGIQTSGELIMATLNGPETYYDYHGKSLGTQYLICQRFADSLGVRLRVDVCRDSIELAQRQQTGDADLIAWGRQGRSMLAVRSPNWQRCCDGGTVRRVSTRPAGRSMNCSPSVRSAAVSSRRCSTPREVSSLITTISS